jgi:hypothetical protein
MPFRLSGLVLNRVDLCPAGANQGAEIVLFKSKEGSVPKKVPTKKKAAAKVPAKKPVTKTPNTKSKKDEEEDDEEDEEEVIEKDDDGDEDEDEDADDDADEGDGDDEDEDEDDEDVQKTKKKPAKAPAKKSKRVAKADDDADDDEEDILDAEDDEEELPASVLKSLPVSVQKRLAKVSKDAREAREMVAVEKDKRETLEFVAKAKADIPNLTGTPDDKGAMLKALYSGQAITKKVADAIVKLLKTGDAAVRDLLMSETGSRGRTEEQDTAEAAINEKRDALMKADPKLTSAQARSLACQQNPDLFRKYKIEKARARREDN